MWKRWLTVSAAAILLLVGCTKEEKVVEQKEPKTEEKEIIPEEEKELPYQFPLTGVGTEDKVEGRAVAVMVNNHPKARPQSGLHQADIVYELLAEGNVTRFLAIFQSEQPDNIGPVRSAREYYIELAKGYDGLFVAHGYSPEAEQMLKKGYVDSINGMQYDGSLFKRASFRVAPHNSYISFENILKGAEKNDFDMEKAPDSLAFLSEDEVKALAGNVASTVNISYYDQTFSSSFEYDGTLEKYKRFTNGVQTVDYDSEEPVLVDNIFVVETTHQIIDDAGRRDIDLTSGGNAYLFQKGQMTAIEWKNVEGKILPYLNGKEVGLVPGKTWINVIPTSPGLDGAVTYQ
jgi:hypothetical protein